jgi:predicted lactoylglutathione lyase
MKLGDGVQITVGTNSIVESFPFYEKLGFKKVEQQSESYNWLLITDGIIKLLLHQDKFKGLGYFASDMQMRVQKFKDAGIKFENERLQLKQFYAVIKDPSGYKISLIEQDASKMFKPRGVSHSTIGDFSEVSLISKNVKKSLEFYSMLGFKIEMFEESEFPRGMISDGLITIGLYSSASAMLNFDGWAYKYISKNPAKRIEGLKKKKINFFKEIKNDSGQISEASLLSPDNETFLITNKS